MVAGKYLKMTVEEMIPDEQIDQVWGNADFGSPSKREVIRSTLLKCASGFDTGYTAKCIARELGLIYTTKWQLTRRGQLYLWTAYSNGSNF